MRDIRPKTIFGIRDVGPGGIFAKYYVAISDLGGGKWRVAALDEANIEAIFANSPLRRETFDFTGIIVAQLMILS